MVGQPVWVILRFIRKTAAEMIHGQDAVFGRKFLDNVAIKERPRRIAMDANDGGVGVARAFVHIMQAARRSLQPMRRKGVKCTHFGR